MLNTAARVVGIFGITCLATLTLAAQIPYINFLKPLETTRTDLEARFGIGKRDCRCLYEVSDATITAVYPIRSCEEGWKVGEDVAIRFIIVPKPQVTVASLNEDLRPFYKTVDDTTAASYTDPKRGIILRLSPYDELEQIEIIPSTAKGKEAHLRCSAVDPYSPMNRVYSPVDSFEMRGWPYDVPPLNNVLVSFTSAAGKRLYIFLHFDAATTAAVKARYLKEIRTRVVQALGKKAKLVTVTSARSEGASRVVAYIIDKHLPAPLP